MGKKRKNVYSYFNKSKVTLFSVWVHSWPFPIVSNVSFLANMEDNTRRIQLIMLWKRMWALLTGSKIIYARKSKLSISWKKGSVFHWFFFHDSFPYCKRRVCLTLHSAYLSRFRVVSDEGWANYTRGERKHEARRTDLASRAGNSVSNETTCSLAWRVIVLWVDVWKGEQLVTFDWVPVA